MSAYKYSPLSIETAKKIIGLKIVRQKVLLAKYAKTTASSSIGFKNSIGEILLEEARMAQKFWQEFGKLLSKELDFPGRKPRNNDITNRLLDIGYHHLSNVVRQILKRLEIPTPLALIHVARTARSEPLAYDLVEMFRADIVEAEVLKFLRLKKKKPEHIENEIAHFLHEINERLEKKYYLKDFKTCHMYRYYIEIQILKFVKAVNHKQVFEPVKLPKRHESRCDVDART